MRISDWSSDVCSSDLGSPQVSRLDAAGGVTVTRPDQSARGNYAVYDLNRRVITMIGGVTLTQGGNTVNGGRLTITLDTGRAVIDRSEEHTSELQSLMRTSYAVFCLKKKKTTRREP